MHIPTIFNDVIIILVISVAAAILFRQLKMPTIIGFLITGVLAGPHLLALVKNVHDVEILAEIGVILLLFSVGIEFSLAEFINMRKSVIVTGGLQVLLTTLAVTFICTQFGLTTSQGIFIGFLISLSSTAIVLKLLQERGEIISLHGKTILGILIFQDLIVVPMMLFTPLLSGQETDIFNEVILLAVKMVLVLVGMVVIIKFIIPRLLYNVAKTRSNEIFLLTIVAFCFTVAWFTSTLGLSLALGAFIAGLIISESNYKLQASSYVLPFREIFESFFFVSIGMLLDIRFVIENYIIVFSITAAVIILKILITSIASYGINKSLRIITLTSLAICQVGEFSFILSKIGVTEGIIDDTLNQYFLSVSVLSMSAAPVIIHFMHKISNLLPASKADRKKFISKSYKNHLVILGFGFNGRTIAKAAQYAVIPYVAVDLDAEQVAKEIEQGENVIFGDAVYEHILESVSIEKARVVVIGISDIVGTKRIITAIRKLNEEVYILARTRSVKDVKELKMIGANEVISEEFQTAIEIFSRVLSKYLIPQDDITKFVDVICADNYQLLSPQPIKTDAAGDIQLHFSDYDFSALRVSAGSKFINLKLADANIRRDYDISLLGIRRDGKLTMLPVGEDVLKEGDVVYVFGLPDNIRNFKIDLKKG